MNLSSAREFKDQVLRSASVVVETHTYAVRRAPGRAKAIHERVNIPVAAIGNAPARRGYKVVARLYKGSEARARMVVAEMQRYPNETEISFGVVYKPRITLRAGVSCGHYNITAGRLGAFVEDDDHYYILSNDHVLADSDGGRAAV